MVLIKLSGGAAPLCPLPDCKLVCVAFFVRGELWRFGPCRHCLATFHLVSYGGYKT